MSQRDPRAVYCEPHCRLQAWAARQGPLQAALSFEPATVPLPTLNPTVPKNRKRDLQSKYLAILGRLQYGPATRAEVKGLGGDRFSARIGEIRDAGHYVVGPAPSPKHGIFETTKPGLDGQDVYELRR